MYLGRFQAGQTVPLRVVTRNAVNTPSEPTEAPTFEVWNDSARIVSNQKMPISDRYGATGLFFSPLFLNSSYPAARYHVTYSWAISSTAYAEEDIFEVVAGGDPNGHVRSMTWAEFPHANFLVHHLEDGTVIFGRNPRA